MKLDCPTCGAPIDSDDVDINQLVAKCSACDNVFSFADEVRAPEAGKRREVGMPKGIRVDPLPDGMEIRRRWFTPVVFFLTFFCILWDGFLVVWYANAFGNNGPLIVKIFPLGHLAVGIGLTWYTIALWLNTTLIKVSYNQLVVRHSPVPWRGNRSLDAASVEQLSVEKKVSHNKNGTSVSFRLRLHTTDGRMLKLLTTDKEAQARYIEQEIERFLDLKDKRMSGEYRG